LRSSLAVFESSPYISTFTTGLLYISFLFTYLLLEKGKGRYVISSPNTEQELIASLLAANSTLKKELLKAKVNHLERINISEKF
jgi:hypothetical protein